MGTRCSIAIVQFWQLWLLLGCSMQERRKMFRATWVFSICSVKCSLQASRPNFETALCQKNLGGGCPPAPLVPTPMVCLGGIRAAKKRLIKSLLLTTSSSGRIVRALVMIHLGYPSTQFCAGFPVCSALFCFLT